MWFTLYLLYYSILRHITNSIVNKAPELLQYWDYEGNEGVDPANVHYGSNGYYSWICPNCNKTFLRSVYQQKNAKNKFCEHCARSQGTKGRAVKRLIEQGSLFDARPDLLDFWDEKLNSGILPNKVPKNSQFKIVIKCPTCGRTREARTMDLLKTKYPCRHCYDIKRKKTKNESRDWHLESRGRFYWSFESRGRFYWSFLENRICKYLTLIQVPVPVVH